MISDICCFPLVLHKNGDKNDYDCTQSTLAEAYSGQK